MTRGNASATIGNITETTMQNRSHSVPAESGTSTCKESKLFLQRLFHLQFRNQLFIVASLFVSQNSPRISQHAAETGRHMPEPPGVAVAHQSTQRVPQRTDKCDAINSCHPQRHERFLFHPVHRHFILHAEKMHRCAASLLHKTPER